MFRHLFNHTLNFQSNKNTNLEIIIEIKLIVTDTNIIFYFTLMILPVETLMYKKSTSHFILI